MNKKIKVLVTKEHIKAARKLLAPGYIYLGIYRGDSCPLSLALSEKFGISNVEKRFWVGDTWASDYKHYFSLSRGAKKFIKDFDHKKSVKPSTFYLTQKE